jgi:hypothetical protein
MWAHNDGTPCHHRFICLRGANLPRGATLTTPTPPRIQQAKHTVAERSRVVTPVVTPWAFAKALEAAGIIHNRERITEIIISCKPDDVVTIEVTYLADERLYTLINPQEKQ